MNKLEMQSANGVSINIEKIAALFPNCVTETTDKNGNICKGIDFDKLKEELSDDIIDNSKERYQFTWPDKRQAIHTANTPITKTLRPCREDSVDFDNTQNLYIEGDNLDVLKLLRENYLGKVKMIYIDPPYNTGNDFVYNDNFKMDEDLFSEASGEKDDVGNRMVVNSDSNGRFHTDWLNMMYPRLKVAKDLLTEDGVIFISIDDNEQENLKKICDEIFGENNKVETVIWKNKYGAGAKTVGFISAHEYILIYSKNPINNITCEFEGEEKDKYNKKDDKFETRGPYRTQPLMTNSLGDRPNLMYSIFYKGVEIKPHKQWVWSKERMEKAIENDDVEFSLQKDGSYTIRSKSYLYDANGNMRRGKPVSVLNGPFTQDGTKEMRLLFDDMSVFDFTKPSTLIEYLLKLEVNDKSSNDSIVLDFFSGSATTAQAVMSINSNEKSRRKFVMVQIQDKVAVDTVAYKAGYSTICEIGKERIRRAAKKIKEEMEAEGKDTSNMDFGFRVLKLDSSNMKDVYYTPQETTPDLFSADNVKEDRTAEDLLFQVMPKCDLMLSEKIIKENIKGKDVYFVKDNYLAACFDMDLTDDVIKEIAKRQPFHFVMKEGGAAKDSVLDNFEQIFKTYSAGTKCMVI